MSVSLTNIVIVLTKKFYLAGHSIPAALQAEEESRVGEAAADSDCAQLKGSFLSGTDQLL